MGTMIAFILQIYICICIHMYVTQSQRHSEGKHVTVEAETAGVQQGANECQDHRQAPETRTEAGVEDILPLSPQEGRTQRPQASLTVRGDIPVALTHCTGFPGSSVGKESACDAGDPGSIPGSGRSAGEGIGSPLQCSWASLVAELVKNPPAMRENGLNPWVGKIPLEEGMATHSSIPAWRIPTGRGAWRATVCGVAKSRTRLSD